MVKKYSVLADDLLGGVEATHMDGNAGGARRNINGDTWETFLADCVRNVNEESGSPYTITDTHKNNCTKIKFPVPGTEDTEQRNPDVIAWGNDGPQFTFSSKTYGDKTQTCAEMITTQLCKTYYPNTFRKAIFFRGHRGGPLKTQQNLCTLLGIRDVVEFYDFFPLTRNSKNERIIDTFDKDYIIGRIDAFHSFLAERL